MAGPKMIQLQGDSFTVFQSALYQTTSTVICTKDIVLCVDPTCLPDEVETIRRYIRLIQGDRPLYLLFTHTDWDHVLGYGAFSKEGMAIASKRTAELADPERILHEIRQFDEQYYVVRGHPIQYPKVDYPIDRDDEEIQFGSTTIRFWQAPGHTDDGLFAFIEPEGIFIAGDYLSDIEFPFMTDSYAYEATLEKALQILNSGKVALTVPGHGRATASVAQAKLRVETSLQYIWDLRAACASGKPEEADHWLGKYTFASGMRSLHQDNIQLIQKELDL